MNSLTHEAQGRAPTRFCGADRHLMIWKTWRFGIVGELGPLAVADTFFKRAKAAAMQSHREHVGIVFEQHPFDDAMSCRV